MQYYTKYLFSLGELDSISRKPWMKESLLKAKSFAEEVITILEDRDFPNLNPSTGNRKFDDVFDTVIEGLHIGEISGRYALKLFRGYHSELDRALKSF